MPAWQCEGQQRAEQADARAVIARMALGVGRNIGQCFDRAQRAFHTVKANRTIVIYVTFSGYAEPVTSRVSPQDPQNISRRIRAGGQQTLTSRAGATFIWRCLPGQTKASS